MVIEKASWWTGCAVCVCVWSEGFKVRANTRCKPANILVQPGGTEFGSVLRFDLEQFTLKIDADKASNCDVFLSLFIIMRSKVLDTHVL